MEAKEIQERNKQIALMFGLKPLSKPYDGAFTSDDKTYNSFRIFFSGLLEDESWYEYPKFHSDWNWLMEAKRFAERKGFDISIRGHDIMVYRPFRQHYNVRLVEPKLDADVDDSSIIEAVFTAVSDFAKLYNEKKL